LRADLPGSAGTRSGGQSGAGAFAAQPGSATAFGLQAALQRTETTDGCAEQAAGYAADDRSRGEGDGGVHSLVARSGERVPGGDSPIEGADGRFEGLLLRNAV